MLELQKPQASVTQTHRATVFDISTQSTVPGFARPSEEQEDRLLMSVGPGTLLPALYVLIHAGPSPRVPPTHIQSV